MHLKRVHKCHLGIGMLIWHSVYKLQNQFVVLLQTKTQKNNVNEDLFKSKYNKTRL